MWSDYPGKELQNELYLVGVFDRTERYDETYPEKEDFDVHDIISKSSGTRSLSEVPISSSAHTLSSRISKIAATRLRTLGNCSVLARKI